MNHILIVGGNPINHRLFVHLLTEAGYTTAPLDAITEAQMHGNLIVVDALGTDALDLARRVRAASTIPMLAVSSAFGEIEAKAAGYDGFLRKPILPAVFLATVQSLLENNNNETVRQ